MRELFESIPADLRIGHEVFIFGAAVGGLFSILAWSLLGFLLSLIVFLIAVNAHGRTLRDEMDEQGLGE